MQDIEYFLAFGAGFLSFISPCALRFIRHFYRTLTVFGFWIEEKNAECSQRIWTYSVFLTWILIILLQWLIGTKFLWGIFTDYKD